jgi:trimeric autotransporter adhesin
MSRFAIRLASPAVTSHSTFRIAFLRVIAVLFALSSTIAFAQVTTGTILGTVTDPSGAKIAGAKVTITNTDTGVVSNIVNRSDGNFELPYLPNGPYSVKIDAPGFKSFSQTGVVLNIGQQYRIDAKLRIGQSAQSVVVVVADAQVLRSEDSQLSETIDQRTIEETPNINRNPLLTSSLVAGVVTTGTFMDPNNVNTGDNSRQNFTSFVVNGSAPLASNIQLDGAMDTSPYANEILVMPNLEAIAESNIVTNAYSAEYGRTAGGVINFTTKSGTDKYHFVLYEDYRNTDLDANSFGNKDSNPIRPKAPFNSNLFGATFGGPLVIPKVYNGRGKTFFFASYEGLRRNQGTSTYYTVPTALERTGNFSQTKTLVNVNGSPVAEPVSIYLPFPGTTTTTIPAPGQIQINRQPAVYNGAANVIPPQYLDPTALKFVNYYPLPNITPLNQDGTDNYFTNDVANIDTDQIIVRLDQNFSATKRGFFRYTSDWTLNNPPNIFAGTNPAANNNGATTQYNPSATGGFDWTLSPKDALELRANLSRLNLVLVPCCGGSNTDFGALGFSPSEIVGLPTTAFPNVNVGTGTAEYPAMGLTGFEFRQNHTTLFSVTPNYTRLLNKLSMKIGMEYEDILYNFNQPQDASMDFTAAASTFSQACEGTGCPAIPVNTPQGWAAANFLMGANDGGNGNGQYTTGNPTEALKNGYWAIYSQNDWKVTHDLTLNLGLRWEFQGPITSRHNRLSQFNLNGINETGTPGLYQFSGVGGDPRGQVNDAWRNWSPRVGFAYRANEKTVVSGAYGISYIMTTGAGSGAQGFGSDGFAAPAFIQIRPSTGVDANQDILQNTWTNAFKSGGVTAGSNPLNPTLLGQSVTAVIRTDNQTPYIQQFNFAVQRQLPSSTIVQIAYVGTTGTHLQLQQIPANQIDDIPAATLNSAVNTLATTGVNPLTTLVANPFYGTITGNSNLDNPTIQQLYLNEPFPAYGNVTRWFDRKGVSSYNSLQITARRSYKNGFQLGGTYTFSKNIDLGQGYGAAQQTGSSEGSPYFAPGNRQLDRSVSEFDQPHRGVIDFIWDLPVGKGHKYLAHVPVATQVLGGWKLSAITTFASGYPIGITSSTGFGRPNVIADPRLPKRDQISSGSVVLPTGQSYTVTSGYKLYFNPYAFTAPVLTTPNPSAPGTTVNVADPYFYGNAPRLYSALRTPGIDNTDLSIAHDYHITERLNLNLRIDAFNAPNRVQPGTPINSFGTPNLTNTNPGSTGPSNVGYSSSNTFGALQMNTAQTAIGSAENTPRYVQLSGRLSW